MKIQVHLPDSIPFEHPLFKADFLKSKLSEFQNIIQDPDIGFFYLDETSSHLEDCKKVYEQFADRSHFVHVGIGGSSLGPEMLISALATTTTSKQVQRTFHFINNIDPHLIHQCLMKLEAEKTLFYFVSKSGGTAETMAAFAIISQWLKEKKVPAHDLSRYFVFATDPLKGDLLELSKQYGIPCLSIPSNVGGRFSVLTPVGLLPAFFANLSPQNLLQGAKAIRPFLLNEDYTKNQLLLLASYLYLLKKEHHVHQTVLMPYSSRLRDFSFWFVQLWAESLGKKFNHKKEAVHEGLTPIPSYGATDQHSQLQLFMEGPLDKCVLFLEVENSQYDFKLGNEFKVPSLQKLSSFTLGQLFKAELEGTIQGLKDVGRPFIRFSIEKLDEYHLGGLILLFESLTVLMGQYLQINPFDQPGVEASKRFAFQWLDRLRQ